MKYKTIFTLVVLLKLTSAIASQINNVDDEMHGNFRIIKPHTHTAAENAKHNQECAEMGGVDITDEVTNIIGNAVNDSAVCKILNIEAFNAYNKKHKFKEYVHSADNTPNSSIVPIAPSGTVNNLSFLVIGYATFSNTLMYENAGTLETGVDGDSSPYCNQSSFFGVPPTSRDNVYSITLSCTEKNYGKYDSYTTGSLSIGGSVTDKGFVDVKNPFDIAKNTGNPENVWGCNIPTSFTSNPINIGIGNKYQKELDIIGNGSADPLIMTRAYNSTDGIWRHNYSTKLEGINQTNNSNSTIEMIGNDGRASYFEDNKGVITTDPSELGTLKKVGSNYEYTSPFHEISEFDSNGLLIKTISNGGFVHNIKHLSNTELEVSNQFGSSLTIKETDQHQPLSVSSSDGTTVNYKYDNRKRLIEVTVDGKSRIYHYEDSKFPFALTGITNERDIRYATWTYDDKGRANSSVLDDGKDKVEITYNSDTKTTLINPLGRKYIYDFTYIDGIKRITTINGEKSSGCPAIGTSYEYNNRALVSMSTDGRGIKTQYNYNNSGQEISRVVGYGSSEALTIKTIWDDRFNLPKSETFPDKVISYDYDSYGNLINQTIKSVN